MAKNDNLGKNIKANQMLECVQDDYELAFNVHTLSDMIRAGVNHCILLITSCAKDILKGVKKYFYNL